ncbi:MAG: hypothetical protein JNL72_04155 [Flavipsychrobacter sp.]|nr:hypothetical protein [Flavipsychrobacter sp.]
MSTLVVFAGLTISSCGNDPCKAIVCAYGGVCADGECTCATGYEGTQCEKVSREKFMGTWGVTEKGTLTNPAIYNVSIEPAEAIQDVTIANFYNLFPGEVRVKARVSNDTLYIDRQEAFNRVVEGVGYIDQPATKEENAHMIMRYYVADPSTGKINDFGWDAGQPSEWELQDQ